jgi:hypothetical protein
MARWFPGLRRRTTLNNMGTRSRVGSRSRVGPRSLVALVMAAALWVPSGAAAASPSLTSFISDPVNLSGATSVAVAGNYAYTTAYYPGRLTAIAISNPANVTIAGVSASANSLFDASTVNIAGGYAYVASKNRNLSTTNNDDGTGNSLTILDIHTNPAQPAIVGFVRDATKLFGAYGVAMSGNYAYVAAQGCLSGQPCPKSNVGNAFEVLDVSNPASPTIVATLHNSALPAPFTGTALSHADSTAVAGHYAYVTASYSNRLTIIDISNPLIPKVVSSLLDNTNLNFPVDVAVQGNYAYVADQISTGRLTVVDVSNPANPQVVSSLPNSALNGAYRVRLRGNFAFVSGSSSNAIAAVDISNPLSPRLAASYTDSAHLHKTTGLDLDPTGRYVIASSPFLSTETQTNYPPFPQQTGGPTATGSISMIDLDPSPISVAITPSSEPPSSTANTSANFAFAANDPVSSVQCKLDSAPYSLCSTPTGAQYSSLAAGSHTFTVQATDAAGNTAPDTYTWTIQAAPVSTSLPTVSGTPTEGQTLTAGNGSWTGTPAPSFSYQWLRCDSSGANCSPISGATSQTYAVQAADAGLTLAVTVTGSNSAGSVPATSAPPVAVTAAASAPVSTSLPTVSGTPTEGQTLTAGNGSWTGTPAPSFSYQWQRCNSSGANCAPIFGATGQTYTVVSADVGSKLNVVVTGTNTSGSTAAASASSAVVTSAPGPVTGLLDDFNRPNNSGPPGPNWTYMVVSSTSASNNLLITGQQITGTSGSNADYWNPQTYGPNSEVWVTVVTKPTADLDPVVLGLRFQNPGLATASGYQAYYSYRATPPDQYKIIVRVNGTTSTTLASANGPTLNPGDQLLFRAIGSTLELWRGTGSTWTRILAATDGTYPGAGYLNLTTRNSVVRLDNYGGGTLP